jgi:sec-independent protein translocase protein TatB
LFDIGITKLAIIGAIALVVIGPDKLPALAKTVGTLLGRARRYVADVKSEVSRSMHLDEIKKMQEAMDTAARDVENTIQTQASKFDQSLLDEPVTYTGASEMEPYATFPEYRHPKKKWRIKVTATPHWYKARTGIRSKAQSGAARVARYRPRPNTL